MSISNFSYIISRPFFLSHCISLVIHLNQSPEVWLFNCNEGVQHNLLKYKIKLSIISKIFITCFTAKNISGLLGLLSTLNMDNRNKVLEIYASQKLQKYLKFSNKYSQTNYSFYVKIHTLESYNFFVNSLYVIRGISMDNEHQEFSYIITFRQNLGKFNLWYAMLFNIVRGPIYGKLKQDCNFIVPDGLEIQGKQFSNTQYKSKKLLVLSKYPKNIKAKFILKKLSYIVDQIIYMN